jgi:hypothetical protein
MYRLYSHHPKGMEFYRASNSRVRSAVEGPVFRGLCKALNLFRIWGDRIVGTSAAILCAGHKVLNLSKKEVEYYLSGYRAYPQCIDFWKNKVFPAMV